MIPVTILFISFFTISDVAAKLNNETDRLALLAFKELIQQDPPGSLSSWNDSLSLCEWHGVMCGQLHNRVTKLDLWSQGLAGLISPSIGNLTFLRSIRLQDNQLRGTIPTEILHLPRLQHLNLSYNSIDGDLPSHMPNSSQLRVVNFSFNNLTGEIPGSFGSLSQLTFLVFYENKLTGRIPSSLGNLTFLKTLSLGLNCLVGTIPNSIGNLTNLGYFGVPVNNLTGAVPPSIYNISSLERLYIADNNLSGSLPLDIGLTLPNLETLSTGGNQLSGSFPISLSNASQMKMLSIQHSGLMGSVPVDIGKRMNNLQWLDLLRNDLGSGREGDLSFVDSLTNCSKIRVFCISGNRFGGVLPMSLSNLSTELSFLLATENEFVGTIPVGICNLVNLLRLELSSNNLFGPIPSEIGKLKSLRRLYLFENKLWGPVPSSMANLSQIFGLALSDNILTGGISIIIDNIQGLQSVDLSYNAFTGSLPKTIGSLYTATFVYLTDNSFQGSIPLEIGSLKNLQEFDLSNNKVSGEIPSTFGNCLKLEFLSLRCNLFRGKIPPSLGLLKGITLLDLSHNKMYGQIPIVLETLLYLNNFNVSFNNLDGEVPLEGVFKNSSAISVEGNFNLCGGIPALHLPACSKRRNRHYWRIVAITVGIGAGSIFVSLFVLLYWRRKNRSKPSTESNNGDEYSRISYGELLTATEGFALSNLIGTGQFSSVFKGILPLIEKPIAVKVLNLDKIGASKSFIAECEALRIARHRNLLKIITACSSVTFKGEDFKALVFEFMLNGSLELWLHHNHYDGLHERSLDFFQRLNIAIGVASALEYLHHHCKPSIVHCDLKPSNILLDEHMIPHVGDFGLARFLNMNTNDEGSETSSIAIKGTIGYVPPEYGLGGQVSTEGDIYSYGILLLEMLTGKKPTDEMFANNLSLHDHCRRAWPGRIMDIVDSCLLPEPNNDKQAQEESRMIECLCSLLSIGIACSAELPNERMNMKNVVIKLNVAKEVFLGTGIHGHWHIRMGDAGKRLS